MNDLPLRPLATFRARCKLERGLEESRSDVAGDVLTDLRNRGER